MKYNPEIHHRRSIRLKEYNYSQNGAYFITICAYNRKCLFGEIVHDVMVLNNVGLLVRDEWIKSFDIRAEIEMDEYIIMPNHLHGIVFINNWFDVKKGDRPVAPTGKSIGSFIAGFKSTVTKQINEIHKTYGTPFWQRNYYEHIIRNEKSLEQIREYVVNNPQTWQKDKLYTV